MSRGIFLKKELLKYIDFVSESAITLNEPKFRMPQICGIKGEAVVVYSEPLITKEMGYYQLSRRVKKWDCI